MSRLMKMLRAAGLAALFGAGASPATAQYRPAPTATAAAPGLATDDLLQSSFHRRSAPPAQWAPPGYCPPGATPAPGMPNPNPNPNPMPQPEAAPPAAPDLFAGADAGPTAGLGGYIDQALPLTQFRLRYDNAWGNNRPDRANFFYAKCGCFGSPNAVGPPLPETGVESQTLSAYFEYAVTERFSVFSNVPVRFINPEQNRNAAGVSDLHFGAKYAFLYNSTRVVSFQLQAIVPTGDTRLGLGSGSTWLEPGILYQEQLTPDWQVFGQVKDQIPLTRVSDFAGNVLTYGLGSSYTVARGCWGYVAPVGEVVGWTVLSGRELNPDLGNDVSARGATIVNAKFGVRFGFGEGDGVNPSDSDLYIGYGRALTGEVWYKDMLRVEFRRFF